MKHSPPIGRIAKQQLKKYFSGKLKEFDVNLEFKGTPFQIKVWRALQKIPFGETRTYQQIACSIGHPKAVRAVGNACGKNPYLILVPCHRVLASDGSLGGFSSGLKLKRKLLRHEGVQV